MSLRHTCTVSHQYLTMSILCELVKAQLAFLLTLKPNFHVYETIPPRKAFVSMHMQFMHYPVPIVAKIVLKIRILTSKDFYLHHVTVSNRPVSENIGHMATECTNKKSDVRKRSQKTTTGIIVSPTTYWTH